MELQAFRTDSAALQTRSDAKSTTRHDRWRPPSNARLIRLRYTSSLPLYHLITLLATISIRMHVISPRKFTRGSCAFTCVEISRAQASITARCTSCPLVATDAKLEFAVTSLAITPACC